VAAVVPLVADLLLLLQAADRRASATPKANNGTRLRVFCIKVRPPFSSLSQTVAAEIPIALSGLYDTCVALSTRRRLASPLHRGPAWYTCRPVETDGPAFRRGASR
jgi:hypothetical protein